MPVQHNIKPLGIADVERRIKKLGKLGLKVGVLGGRYPDGAPIAMVASVHEFGFKNENIDIPERSFMRSTAVEKRKDWVDLAGRLVKSALTGKIEPKDALSLLGDQIAGDIKQKIVSLKTPANEPSTIAAKGSSNPLIDTGILVNSIDFEVTK